MPKRDTKNKKAELQQAQSTLAASAEALAPMLEALLFAAEQPIPKSTFVEITGAALPEIEQALQILQQRYAPPWGVALSEVAAGFQLRSAAAFREPIALLLRSKPQRLSRAALETLSIIAYKQPLTRPEVDEIRGVDSGGALKTLLDRKLVRMLGRKEEPGRPVLYGTSREFLGFFGLRDLSSLPSLHELRQLREEEQAQEIGQPETVPLLQARERKTGEIAPTIVDALEQALQQAEAVNKQLRGQEQAPEADGPLVSPK
jgi:segregation and condensation protein B